MARTIVVSDVHGDAGMLETVLAHADFEPEDTLIVAGDLLDIGPGDALAYAERSGAVILPGNHEVAAALGLRISPQHPSSLERGPELLDNMLGRRWPLAVAVEGILITHAGISTALDDVIERADGNPQTIANALNAEFVAELAVLAESQPESWSTVAHFRLVGGQLGPLWFRPLDPDRVPLGLRQIAGHTPPDMLTPADREAVAARGLLMIEPGSHSRRRGLLGALRPGAPTLRYAVIENGEAHLVEA